MKNYLFIYLLFLSLSGFSQRYIFKPSSDRTYIVYNESNILPDTTYRLLEDLYLQDRIIKIVKSVTKAKKSELKKVLGVINLRLYIKDKKVQEVIFSLSSGVVYLLEMQDYNQIERELKYLKFEKSYPIWFSVNLHKNWWD